MWIALNNAFFSVVNTPGLPPKHLLVRARRPGDIEKYWPTAEVKRTPGRDYLFRAEIKAKEVARVLAKAAKEIQYSNFKDSVKDHDLHRAYMSVWDSISAIQDPPPYGRDFYVQPMAAKPQKPASYNVPHLGPRRRMSAPQPVRIPAFEDDYLDDPWPRA